MRPATRRWSCFSYGRRSHRGTDDDFRGATTTYPTATTIAEQRRQVYEGRAQKTRSGLTRKDLMRSKSGKIVSRRASAAAKRNYRTNGLGLYQY